VSVYLESAVQEVGIPIASLISMYASFDPENNIRNFPAYVEKV